MGMNERARFWGIVLAPLFVFMAGCVQPVGEQASRGDYNPDLYAWKTASWTPFTVSDTITGFAWGEVNGGTCIAVSNTGVIGYSYDGDTWKRALVVESPDMEPLIPLTVKYNAAAAGGGKFIAAGEAGGAVVSDDGVRWRKCSLSGFGTEPVRGIAYGEIGGTGYFVAVGGNGNISVSADGGGIWQGGSASGFTGIQFNDIAFGNGRFYVVGNKGHRGWSNTPGDLNSWHPRGPMYPFFTNDIKRVAVGAYGEGPGIAIAFNEWEGRRLAIETKGDFGDSNADWDADINAGNFGNNAINGIAWGGGFFAAAGTGAMIGYWPGADPGNVGERYWRALTFPEFQYWEISVIAACNGRFFAGNVGGRIAYSK
jgi:hypothetical protein